MPDRSFTFEIEEHFGTISKREGGWSKELNLIRWNGGAAKYDIREWDEHHEHMSKGITLTPWEMRKVVDLFVSRNNDAVVARGRAIEAERNARRIAARQKAETSAQTEVDAEPSMQAEQEELQALEGTVTPFDGDEPDVASAEMAEVGTFFTPSGADVPDESQEEETEADF